MGLSDFRPFARISINGQRLSGFVFSQVTSVRVVDKAGISSDTAEIAFSNTGLAQRIVMPDPGAEIAIELGYPLGFRDMGLFVAHEIEEGNTPRQIKILARAKSHGQTSGGLGPIMQQKSRSWAAGLTIKDIAERIASDNGLQPAVTPSVASIVPGHVDQLDESDMSLLTRLAITHDLLAKPTAGRLFLGLRSEGVTASGSPMPSVSLMEREVSSWMMRRSLTEKVGTVIASYRDLSQATDVEVSVGDGEPVRRLRHRYADRARAEAAARAESRRAARSTEVLEVQMPGNASIVAEATINPLDFSTAALGAWVVENATHELSEVGYITSLTAQRPEAQPA